MLHSPVLISPVFADPTALIIWLSVGLLALVVGAVSVAVSRRRILSADRNVMMNPQSTSRTF